MTVPSENPGSNAADRYSETIRGRRKQELFVPNSGSFNSDLALTTR